MTGLLSLIGLGWDTTLEDRLRRLKDVVNENEETTEELIEVVKTERVKINQLVTSYDRMASNLETVHNEFLHLREREVVVEFREKWLIAFDAVENQVWLLEGILHDIWLGKFPVHMVDPIHLQQAMETVMRKAEEKQLFPIFQKSRILYEGAETSVVVKDEGVVQILIHIPMTAGTKRWELFRMVSRPLFRQGHWFRVQESDHHLAVDRSSGEVRVIASRNLKDCVSKVGLIICERPIPMRKDQEVCVRALYVNEWEKVRTTCKMSVEQPPSHDIQILGRTVQVFVQEKGIVWFQCAGRAERVAVEAGFTNFIDKDLCTIKTGDIELTLGNSKRLTITEKITLNFPLTVLTNWTKTDLRDDWLPMDDIQPMTLSDIDDKRTSRTTMDTTTVWTVIMAIGITFGLTLIGTGLLGWKLMRKRAARAEQLNQKQEEGQDSSSETTSNRNFVGGDK